MHFEHWKDDNDYDRLGINNEYMDILGVDVRKLVVPVRPGRNIAVLVEAAAANYRYSLMSSISPIDMINNRIDAVSDEEN
jgi:HPr kinase/phosphorylase